MSSSAASRRASGSRSERPQSSAAPSLIAAARLPGSVCRGALAPRCKWRTEGAEHYEPRFVERPPADHGVLARAHPAGDLLFPPPRHRRHHQRELRRRVDRRHHRAVRLRHRARIDLTRRPQGAAAAEARHGGWPAGRRSPSTVRAVPAASRSRARSGWRRAPAIPCCRFTSRPTATGPPAAGTARRSPSRSRRSRLRSASRSNVPAHAGGADIEAARKDLEERLAVLEERARRLLDSQSGHCRQSGYSCACL